jgi:cysteine-rich repeat protein
VQHALSEQCEPSTHDSSLPYGCKNDCRFALRFCGNERLDAGEECDLGTLNSDAPNSMCRKDCSRTRCGDSILDGGEMCDDGNVVAGDGCDRQCRREAGAFSGDASQWPFGDPNSPFGPNGQLGTPYQYGQGQYPMYPNTQPLPYNLPLAQVATGNISGQGQIAGDTGPVAVSVMAAGAAAGFAWMRRRRGL